MGNYFETDKSKKEYFLATVTSGEHSKTTVNAVKPQPKVEARSVFDKYVSSYGEKRSGVVVRRYGIK